MTEVKKTINKLIDALIEKSTNFLSVNKDGLLEYIDPNDGKEISAHYGLSHLMASLILYGKHSGNVSLIEKGYSLLESMLCRINESQKLPAYHFDFNNFAICLVLDVIDNKILKEKAIKTMVEQSDSNHETINWLPMRMFVNFKRYAYTNDNKYLSKAEKCKSTILKAMNTDGSIEDRLPKGKSFNLQYDISTLATLYLLNQEGNDFEIERPMSFLLDCVAPDGDINYQGRGTNQIFAWGPWIYLLSFLNDKEQLSKALSFIEPRLEIMLENNSMMLNEWNGAEKLYWWDYHYASVYIAHCLLWLVLSTVSKGKHIIKPNKISSAYNDSGIEIFKKGGTFVASFQGRSEYLAEKGPSICAIYIDGRPVVKGSFGPWRGLFGNQNTTEDIVIRNYCGLYSTNRPKKTIFNRISYRIGMKSLNSDKYSIEPMFVPVEISVLEKKVDISWNNNLHRDMMINLPILDKDVELSLNVDGEAHKLFETQKIKTQYGWATLYQSHLSTGVDWNLSIILK